MFWQGPHLAKYAAKEIYKIRKMVTFLFLPFRWPLWSVFAIQLHVIFYTLGHHSTCQVSLFVSVLYINVVNEIKSSQILPTGYEKHHRMPWKKKLFVVNWITVGNLCWGRQKPFSETINIHWLCCYDKW